MAKRDFLSTHQKLSHLSAEKRIAVNEFADRLRARLGPLVREIILFGSKVRGDAEKYSDMDVLIVLSNLSWDLKKAISELAAEENSRHDVLISTIRYDVSTWDDPVVKSSPFARNVRREGVWL